MGESKQVSGLLRNQLQPQNAEYSYDPCTTTALHVEEHRRQNTVQVIPGFTDMRRQENKISTKFHSHTFFTLKKDYRDPEMYLYM